MHSNFFRIIYLLGRQFEYDTVLQLIQNEDYLEDSDIDELRRYDSVKKTGDFNADYDIPKPLDDNNWMPLQIQQNLFSNLISTSVSYTHPNSDI